MWNQINAFWLASYISPMKMKYKRFNNARTIT